MAQPLPSQPNSDASAFIEGLLDAEFAALCAAYDEPDDARFTAQVEAATLSWYDVSIAGAGYRHDKFQRPIAVGTTEEELRLGWDPGPPRDHAADRATLRRASVLRWSRYQHPDHGEVLQFDLSPAKPVIAQRLFSRSLLAWREAGELRVRAIFGPCRSCQTSGSIDSEPCDGCGGRGWVHRYGAPLVELGERLEQHKVLRPEYEPHAEAFDG